MKTTIAAALTIGLTAGANTTAALDRDPSPGSGCSPFVIPANASAAEVSDLVERCSRWPRPGTGGARAQQVAAAGPGAANAAAPDVARGGATDGRQGASFDRPRCALDQAGSDRLPSRECLRCHRSSEAQHPFDVDYERARSRRPRLFRPASEAIARGVLLPENQIRCVTCHSGTSPWRHRIALPPGARTLELVPARDRGFRRPSTSLIPGDAVEPTPLCNACHTTADQ